MCLKEAVVEGGGNAFYKAYGMKGMEYTKKDARFREVFRRSNSELSPLVTETILDRYSAQGFAGVESLVDVGGGNGYTLHLILCRVPTISKAVNFDLPSVIADAPSYPGVEHVAGDMFESVPKGDAIFIKWVMHMWEDEECLKLLRNCFKATPENGKVVVVDTVIPETSETTVAAKALLQFNLYRNGVKPHGKERSLAQFHNLAQLAGFASVRVACSAFNFSVLEFLKT
ncbi:Flavone 3'-O-methyltransferase OMT2 [Linum grandiflorum]